MTIPTLLTPSGDKLVVLPLSDYEDLADVRLHEAAIRGVEQGLIETFFAEQPARYVAASSPLAFWREHCGFTLGALADHASDSEIDTSDIPGEFNSEITDWSGARLGLFAARMAGRGLPAALEPDFASATTTGKNG